MAFLRKLIYKIVRRTGYLLPDKVYIELVFFCKMGRFPDLDHPLTFNEKIQWLKLHDRDERYHRMVDKAEAKRYAEKIIGEGHTLKTYGVWDRPEDIDWDSLPDKFVLKLTAGGGGRSVCICRDKKTFDREDAVRRLRKDYRRDLYRLFREWVYKDVPQRVMAEELLESGVPGDIPPDYKFWCFNGRAEFLMLCRGRDNSDGRSFNFLDRDWNELPFWRKYANSARVPEKPENFDEMIRIAEKLSAGMAFLRVDLYDENGKIYFGELTFYPGSGTNPFHPQEWDRRVGDMLRLEGPKN